MFFCMDHSDQLVGKLEEKRGNLNLKKCVNNELLMASMRVGIVVPGKG